MCDFTITPSKQMRSIKRIHSQPPNHLPLSLFSVKMIQLNCAKLFLAKGQECKILLSLGSCSHLENSYIEKYPIQQSKSKHGHPSETANNLMSELVNSDKLLKK